MNEFLDHDGAAACSGRRGAAAQGVGHPPIAAGMAAMNSRRLKSIDIRT